MAARRTWPRTRSSPGHWTRCTPTGARCPWCGSTGTTRSRHQVGRPACSTCSSMPMPADGPFDLHGLSCFLQDGDVVYHTYSSYGRGTGAIATVGRWRIGSNGQAAQCKDWTQALKPSEGGAALNRRPVVQLICPVAVCTRLSGTPLLKRMTLSSTLLRRMVARSSR
jgi:hypothetical protein